jgi:hypothetical protein
MDLATWLSESEAEFDFLDREEHSNDIKLDKLSITIISTSAKCERLWTIYFESSATYHAAVEARERVRKAYMAEKARRDEENTLLDEVIKMFIERVSALDSGLRNKATEHSSTGGFSDASDISRNTDAHVSKDSGKVAANVAAEAGF